MVFYFISIVVDLFFFHIFIGIKKIIFDLQFNCTFIAYGQ